MQRGSVAEFWAGWEPIRRRDFYSEVVCERNMGRKVEVSRLEDHFWGWIFLDRDGMRLGRFLARARRSWLSFLRGHLFLRCLQSRALQVHFCWRLSLDLLKNPRWPRPRDIVPAAGSRRAPPPAEATITRERDIEF